MPDAIDSSCLIRSRNDACACGTTIVTVCEASGTGASSASARLTSERRPLMPRVTRKRMTISTRIDRAVYGRGFGAPVSPGLPSAVAGGTDALVTNGQLRRPNLMSWCAGMLRVFTVIAQLDGDSELGKVCAVVVQDRRTRVASAAVK